jgi:glycosyltransferase involved in cell wall biosynthesis
MIVSVIIPTYNGGHKLPNVLQSLLLQRIQDFELIVVVDGSADNTKAVLDEWLPKFRQAKCIFQSNGGRSQARNAGAKIAGGDLLFFVDDDMRLEPDCLDQHIKHHEKFPDSLVSGAQVYDDKNATTDFQKYKSIISKNWCSDIQNIYPQPLPPEKLHLTAANFSISKNLFERLGGFDEGVSDMEDFLLAYTATQQHIPVYYLHSAFGWHDDGADIFSMQNRYVQYKKAAMAVAAKYPDLHSKYPRYRTQAVTGVRQLLCRVLSTKALMHLIQNNWLIPQGLRYRLYGAILHAPANLLRQH